jgi:hypothetical protein
MYLSEELKFWLFSIKENNNNELYETICLMILNDEFLYALEELIKNNLKQINFKKKNINFNITSSLKYIESVDLVCRSKYFINNFSKDEIKRKEAIAKNAVVDIVLSLFTKRISKNSGIKLNRVAANFCHTKFPLISHKFYKKNNLKKVSLDFPISTPINEIIEYLEMIEIKNHPQKRKLTLGKGIRLIMIEEKIKADIKKYANKKYTHIGQGESIGYDRIEQLISREMFALYNENISEESVNKSLQRTKKIKKEINKISDK